MPNSTKFPPKKATSIQSSPNAFALEQQRKDVEKRIFDLDQAERRIKLPAK